MPADDIVRARDALVAGSGQTTRKNRVLPAAIVDPQIPQRVGVAPVRLPKSKTGAIWRRGFTTIEIAGTMPPRRFDPYTLATLDFPYGIGVVGYDVTTWASGHNVIDNLPWYDVVCFWANKILINAGEMAALQIPVATPAAPAMPYAIPGQVGVEWGDATLNQSEKRVFAVGRTHVQAFNVGGTTAILSPAQPRADGKAMTIGQRIDRVLHKAWLGQLYYTGVSWDSSGGGWLFSSAEVAMMMVSPFLQQTAGSANVDMPIAQISGSGSSSQPMLDRAYTLPQAPVALIGVGEVWTTSSWPNVNYPGWGVVWAWRSIHYGTMPGRENGYANRSSWSSSQTDSPIQAGRTLSYSQTNVKTIDDEHTSIIVDGATIDLPPQLGAPGSGGSYTLGETNNHQTLQWSDGLGHGPFAPRGIDNTTYSAYVVNGSAAVRLVELQTITASVSCASVNLLEIAASVWRATGQQRTLSANTAPWEYYTVIDPYANVHSTGGFGVSSDVSMMPDNLVFYKNPSGRYEDQPQSAIDEINAEFAARQQGYVGSLCYDQFDPKPKQFSCSVQSGTIYSAALSWRTRDELFNDQINGVLIWIDAEFNGSQTGATGSATLTIRLNIETRHHTVTQQLLQRTYAYASILPEAAITGSSYTAVPSPQIRAIYAPLYQEQGTFKGAAYLTAAEEANTSTPAHLFNFQLRLHNLSDLGQIGNLNLTTDAVHFCPINLCEMLYCFVFSQDYGVGRTTGQRYPVTDTTKYNDLSNTLFSDAYPVLVRDGVAGSWAGNLNGNSAGLYRT